MAAAEVPLRADYFDRNTARYEDLLSVSYQEFRITLTAKQKVRPPYDDSEIPDARKRCGLIDAHVVTQFRDVVRYQN